MVAVYKQRVIKKITKNPDGTETNVEKDPAPIGIIVGAVIAVCAVACVAVVFVIRKKNKKS